MKNEYVNKTLVPKVKVTALTIVIIILAMLNVMMLTAGINVMTVYACIWLDCVTLLITFTVYLIYNLIKKNNEKVKTNIIQLVCTIVSFIAMFIFGSMLFFY